LGFKEIICSQIFRNQIPKLLSAGSRVGLLPELSAKIVHELISKYDDDLLSIWQTAKVSDCQLLDVSTTNFSINYLCGLFLDAKYKLFFELVNSFSIDWIALTNMLLSNITNLYDVKYGIKNVDNKWQLDKLSLRINNMDKLGLNRVIYKLNVFRECLINSKCRFPVLRFRYLIFHG
jgi:hypothetical protein